MTPEEQSSYDYAMAVLNKPIKTSVRGIKITFDPVSFSASVAKAAQMMEEYRKSVARVAATMGIPPSVFSDNK